MSETTLSARIIALSQAKTWNLAKTEWTLAHVYFSDIRQTCLCGHTPIKEVCTLRNRLNGSLAEVGNCCVRKFMGLPSDKIFQSVKRVQVDRMKPLNTEAITFALEKGWINQWEHDFSLNTATRRSLTIKQQETRLKINQKMLTNMRRKT